MNLIILAAAALVAWTVYKRTLSFAQAAIWGAGTLIALPLIIQQIGKLLTN